MHVLQRLNQDERRSGFGLNDLSGRIRATERSAVLCNQPPEAWADLPILIRRPEGQYRIDVSTNVAIQQLQYPGPLWLGGWRAIRKLKGVEHDFHEKEALIVRKVAGLVGCQELIDAFRIRKLHLRFLRVRGDRKPKASCKTGNSLSRREPPKMLRDFHAA
jgi:hypothetical protein